MGSGWSAHIGLIQLFERVGRAGLCGLGGVCAIALTAACDSPERREARTARAIYEANCAVCHGSRRGDEGPRIVAGTGRTAPDLRTLERRLGSPFPRERVAEYIDGRADVEAHGPRDMPVWGDRLYADWPEGDDREAARAGTISLLVDYLESIQVE
ncbi:MAG: c-type cytochrome [Myxococcota bacterium]